MKKNIIALAVASAIVAPVAMADAPTVYGIANAAFGIDATGKDSGQSVDNVASRLGVKGSQDLGNGLKAVYKFEFSVNGFDGKAIGNRNQFVGLAGGFGTVLMGRHDTPTKMSQAKDLFNDGIFDNNKMTNTMAHGENRLNNVLAFVSPSFGGIKLVGALVPSEGGANSDSSLTDTMSFAAMYGSKKKGLYLAAAMDMFGELKVNGAVTRKSSAFTRLSAQYAAAGLVANAMYQMSDASGKEGTNITANVGYKMGKMMPKLKIGMNSEDKSSGNKGTVVALGLNYSLGKKTTAYVEAGSFDKDMGDVTKYNVGLQHKF